VGDNRCRHSYLLRWPVVTGRSLRRRKPARRRRWAKFLTASGRPSGVRPIRLHATGAVADDVAQEAFVRAARASRRRPRTATRAKSAARAALLSRLLRRRDRRRSWRYRRATPHHESAEPAPINAATAAARATRTPSRWRQRGDDCAPARWRLTRSIAWLTAIRVTQGANGHRELQRPSRRSRPLAVQASHRSSTATARREVGLEWRDEQPSAPVEIDDELPQDGSSGGR
jgi:hypothetical protein